MAETPTPTEGSAQETFISHLVELRDRLLRAIIAVVVILLCLFPFAKDIYALLAAPLLQGAAGGRDDDRHRRHRHFPGAAQGDADGGLRVALPYVLWQVWAFVAPGLYQHEKRLALPVILSSFVFFLIGMAFAYFVVFPVVFSFFAGYAPAGVQMMTDIDKYLSFVLTMFIAFGVTFEVPVIVIVLVRLRVVTLAQAEGGPSLRDRRRVRHRRDLHAAGRDLAADARDPAVAALRARHAARALRRAAAAPTREAGAEGEVAAK